MSESGPATGGVDLPLDVGVVLREAAQIVVARSTRHTVAGLTTEAGGVRELLSLLRRSAGLRAGAYGQMRKTVPNLQPGLVATGLVAEEQEAVDRACAAVEHLLQQTVAAQRRARRQAKRADRTVSAGERQDRRDRGRLDEARKARDLAQQRLEHSRAENRDLEREIARLRREADELRAELTSVRAQVHRDRELAKDPRRVAAGLAALLRSSPDPAATADARDVQAGEPRRVGLLAGSQDAPDIGDSLSRAAREAGLPAALRSDITGWLPDLLNALAAPRPPRADVANGLGLRVDVLGGGTEIGGSCVLISAGGTRILIDAGMRPGGHDERTMAPRHVGRTFDGAIDAIVITHAHTDHAGWVPVLARMHPNARLIATRATRDLLHIMWRDSARILAGRTADPMTGAPPEAGFAPFTRVDADRAIERLESVEIGHRFGIGAVAVELFPAGHIVGAAGVVVRAGDRRVVVSGDVSVTPQATVGGIVLPETAVGSDLLLLESTYAGVKKLVPRGRAVTEFIRKISDVVSSGGRVLVPAFALGRAQEIALVLSEHLPDTEVLVDGMARNVSTVYEDYQAPDGAPIRIFGGNVRRLRDRRHELDTFTNGVIISTSGMLTSGPAVEWAGRILTERQSAVMIVGYQDEESPGRRLLDLAKKGGGDFDLPGRDGSTMTVRVGCHVDSYQLGAHASADELVTVTRQTAAAQVMLVHGERERQREFAERLALRHQSTVDADRSWHA